MSHLWAYNRTIITLVLIRCLLFYSISAKKCPTFFQYNLKSISSLYKYFPKHFDLNSKSTNLYLCQNKKAFTFFDHILLSKKFDWNAKTVEIEIGKKKQKRGPNFALSDYNETTGESECSINTNLLVRGCTITVWVTSCLTVFDLTLFRSEWLPIQIPAVHLINPVPEITNLLLKW